jgi:hypothetical protein
MGGRRWCGLVFAVVCRRSPTASDQCSGEEAVDVAVQVPIVKKCRVKSVNSPADVIMMRQVACSESSTRQNHVCDKQDWAVKMSRKGQRQLLVYVWCGPR